MRAANFQLPRLVATERNVLLTSSKVLAPACGKLAMAAGTFWTPRFKAYFATTVHQKAAIHSTLRERGLFLWQHYLFNDVAVPYEWIVKLAAQETGGLLAGAPLIHRVLFFFFLLSAQLATCAVFS